MQQTVELVSTFIRTWRPAGVDHQSSVSYALGALTDSDGATEELLSSIVGNCREALPVCDEFGAQDLLEVLNKVVSGTVATTETLAQVIAAATCQEFRRHRWERGGSLPRIIGGIPPGEQ